MTTEDFEDLALRASREVARARCESQYDLAADPDAKQRRPGVMSVVVVPRSTEPKPIPGAELLGHVKDFLDARRVATADLVVVGPEYVRIDVTADIVVERADEASEVEQSIESAIRNYLHPITGGHGGSGWNFGRLPARSDLYVLIERIAGVSHVRELDVKATADRAGAERTKHFLIYGGTPTLSMTL